MQKTLHLKSISNSVVQFFVRRVPVLNTSHLGALFKQSLVIPCWWVVTRPLDGANTLQDWLTKSRPALSLVQTVLQTGKVRVETFKGWAITRTHDWRFDVRHSRPPPLLTRAQSEKALSASALSVCFVATFYWDKILNSKWETEESSVPLYSSGQSGVASDMRVTSHWTADCPAGSALAADPAPTADCPASVLCCDVSDGFLETIKIRKWRN